MHPLVRFFPREDLNLVFEKWHIVFTDAPETPRPNIFSNEYTEWKIQGKQQRIKSGTNIKYRLSDLG